jgi:lipopolysaccharide/colanic/teichoic acid biosynthesis glycosyltransferase
MESPSFSSLVLPIRARGDVQFPEAAAVSWLDRPAPVARRTALRRLLAGDVPPWKRAMDVIGAAALLVLLAPLFLMIPALIRLHDGGPAVFWQTRVGRRGRCFAFPKFRSMVVNAEAMQDGLMPRNHHAKPSITWKMRNDPRITPVGRFLRRFSLDELPQVWCVLKGDMSLVGPRPPLPREVDRYSPTDLRRLDVAPGLTCLWQVSGRGDLPFEEQVALDVRYIERQSLWLDVELLIRTVPAVLQGRGAY